MTLNELIAELTVLAAQGNGDREVFALRVPHLLSFLATGSFNASGVFIATELLAKHDEKYMPPEVARSLERAAKEGIKK